MRGDYRFTCPVIQDGGVLELRYSYGIRRYKLIITFDGIDASATIKYQTRVPAYMFYDRLETEISTSTWKTIASIKDYSLQGALILAEEILEKELENPEEQDLSHPIP